MTTPRHTPGAFVDIRTLNFEAAPDGYDQSGTTNRCAVAALPDGRQVILTGVDDTTVALTLDLGDHNWISSVDKDSWPILSQQLGDWFGLLCDWKRLGAN